MTCGLEIILDKYGLEWLKTPKSLQHKIAKGNEQEELTAKANKAICDLFEEGGNSLSIEQLRLFLENEESRKILANIPAYLTSSFNFSLVESRGKIEILVDTDYTVIESLLRNFKRQGNKPFRKFLESQRTDKNKLKILFNKEEEPDIAVREYFKLVERFKKEVEESQAMRNFHQELVEYMKEEITKNKIQKQLS